MTYNTNGYLSDLEKGQIISFLKQKLSLSQISKEINRPKSTVLAFLTRYKNNGTLENLPIVGKTPLITERTKRRLVRQAKKARRQPIRELTDEVAPYASVSTIQRSLAEEDIKK